MNNNVPNSQLSIYETADGGTKLDVRLEDVRLENETVWLTQKLMAELFQTTIPNINIHLKNVFDENELDADYRHIRDELRSRSDSGDEHSLF